MTSSATSESAASRSNPNREPQPATEPIVSFVMIAFNEAGRIEQSLKSIQELDDLPDYEIIVVDDGSHDATVQVIQAIALVDTRVSLHALDKNRGRGAARAAGVRIARGHYIAMVDADILLPRDWWKRCRIAIADHDVVSGTAVPDGDVVYLSDRFQLEPKVAKHATSTTGSNAIFRRGVFDVVAYKSEKRNGEDVALSHDMEIHGLSTYVVPGLVVRHQENKTLFQAVSWLFESGIGASRQLETYKKVRQPDQAAAVLIVLSLNALARRKRGRGANIGVLLFALAIIATLHVRSKFVFQKLHPMRYVLGIVTDALLIYSYVCGRAFGHVVVCRRTKH